MKRIFMISSHAMFGQGVETLLCRKRGLEVVGREMDVEEGIERIRELQPDVVILDIGPPAGDPTPIVMRILKEALRTKIVGLNLEDNTMCIYSGEQRMVREVDDLMEAIEGSSSESAHVRKGGQQ